MTTTACPAPSCFAALGQRLATILAALRGAVAARGGRDPSITPLIVLLYVRLNRLGNRFNALVASLLAGHPAAPRRQRARPASAVPARAAPVGSARLPRGHFWMFRLLPGAAACYAGQLEALLAEPEMAALLAAAPEAGRILRPLCRLLSIAPPGALALPSQAGKPAPQPRSVKAAPAATPREPRSAIAIIYAALSGQAAAAPPDPRVHKPPWLRPA